MPLDRNLFFKKFASGRKGAKSLYLVFDLESYDWSIREETLSLPYSMRYQDRYAYLDGVLFRVNFDDEDEDGNEVDYHSDRMLKLERFDKIGQCWVHISQVQHSLQGIVKLIALGDALHILTTCYGGKYEKYFFSVFKIFQIEDGEISGYWDSVNLKFLSPFNSRRGFPLLHN